jgi:hypothetical protein
MLANWSGICLLKGVFEEHGGSRAGVVAERCLISVEVKTNPSPPAAPSSAAASSAGSTTAASLIPSDGCHHFSVAVAHPQSQNHVAK